MTVHFWGEDPRGGWTLTVRYDGTSGQTVLTGLSVTIYGIASTPVAVSHTMPASCGSGYYHNASTLECTSSCGYAMRDGYCYDPTQPEESCVRVMLPSGGAMQRGGGHCCGHPHGVDLVFIFMCVIRLCLCVTKFVYLFQPQYVGTFTMSSC